MARSGSCDAGDGGSTPGLERSLGEGNGKALWHFLPEKFHGQKSMAAATAHGVVKGRLWRSDKTATTH